MPVGILAQVTLSKGHRFESAEEWGGMAGEHPNLECAICLGPIDTLSEDGPSLTLPCKHLFHCYCWEKGRRNYLGTGMHLRREGVSLPRAHMPLVLRTNVAGCPSFARTSSGRTH